MTSLHRRAFLGGVTAGAMLLVTSEPRATMDPRVAALIDLSRDGNARPHVARAAFVSRTGVSGSLELSAREQAELRHAITSGDFTAFRERGIAVGGRKFVFVRETDDGTVLHAVRRGELLTLRATDKELIVATSVDGMVHGRAVEAVYQYTRRTA